MTDLVGTEATLWVLDNGTWEPKVTGRVHGVSSGMDSLVIEVTSTTTGYPPKGTLHRLYFQAGQTERLMFGGGA